MSGVEEVVAGVVGVVDQVGLGLDRHLFEPADVGPWSAFPSGQGGHGRPLAYQVTEHRGPIDLRPVVLGGVTDIELVDHDAAVFGEDLLHFAADHRHRQGGVQPVLEYRPHLGCGPPVQDLSLVSGRGVLPPPAEALEQVSGVAPPPTARIEATLGAGLGFGAVHSYSLTTRRRVVEQLIADGR